MTHYSGSVMAVYFLFEQRMSTGSEAISFLMCLEATKVVCLSAFKVPNINHWNVGFKSH